jgi:DNA helicase-2/ATP-dependent DNA helicase PcrA
LAVLDITGVLEENLTPEQLAAATDPTPEILGLACAGSGKSRTLAFRIARLVAEGVDPAAIVAFTFTEKAADSIKLRVGQALEKAGLPATLVGRMFIGTIHSYCQNVLTQIDARYRQFDVLDENRLKLYLISRYPQLGLSRLRTARSAGGRQIRYFEAIEKVADAWKTMNDEMIGTDDIEASAATPADDELAAVLAELRTRLNADEFIDFSLMIRLVVDALIRGDEDIERAIAPLRHLMVDEYQDVNEAQERLIEQLHARSETLFVVGDDDQAIYAWRGADVNNILTFATRYPGCAEHTLSENFRSTPAIVDAADGFVAAELGAMRMTKTPRAVAARQPRDFRNLWFTRREDEAEWVAERIAALLGTAYEEEAGESARARGLTPADFAILMRSTRQGQSDPEPRHAPFTRELAARDIPYTLEAGGSVFDRPQVAVLRETFELLRSGSPDRRTAQDHFGRRVQPIYPHADFSDFVRVLGTWGRLIHGPSGTRRRVYPQQLVHDLLAAFGIAASDFDEGVMADLGVFSVMMQDVESVYLSVDSAWRFQEILNFLGNIAERGYDSGTLEMLRRPDAVAVMTVHKAKGLEFPAVFVVDVEAQRFPRNRRNYEGWLPRASIGPALARGAYQSTREEEIRLFYTAITRAERYLHVSGCASLPGGTRARRQSAFALGLAHPEISDDPSGLPAGLVPHERRRRVDETIVPTTYSDIRYYLRCPRDFQFRKSFGFAPAITDMFGFGMTVHAAVGKMHERHPTNAPSAQEAEAIVREVFHLKHVPPSNDPQENPGPYERARDSAVRMGRDYAEDYASDFSHARQVEQPFEIPIEQAIISGSIDLLLRIDSEGNVVDASVVDFKSMTGGPEPEDNPDLHWTELALQVQLYATAAREVLGENARTGHVHLLRDGQRVDVPVDDGAVAAAVANVEWAVDRIINGDFPTRPHPAKCAACDFRVLCPKRPDDFATDNRPPEIHVPGGGLELARAFSEYDPDFDGGLPLSTPTP